MAIRNLRYEGDEILSKKSREIEKIEKSGLEYDKKDMILKKKQLAELRFEIQKREHMESHESESWNEFEEEEQEGYDEEER